MNEENRTVEMTVADKKDNSEQLILRESDNPEQIFGVVENQDEEIKKVNYFNTILSIWNSMKGSSTVLLPYNSYNSGIIPTIFLKYYNNYLNH